MQKNINNDNLLVKKEVMQKLRIKSINTMYKLIREGKLKPMRISGGIQCFWESDINKLLEGLQNNVA